MLYFIPTFNTFLIWSLKVKVKVIGVIIVRCILTTLSRGKELKWYYLDWKHEWTLHYSSRLNNAGGWTEWKVFDELATLSTFYVNVTCSISWRGFVIDYSSNYAFIKLMKTFVCNFILPPLRLFLRSWHKSTRQQKEFAHSKRTWGKRISAWQTLQNKIWNWNTTLPFCSMPNMVYNGGIAVLCIIRIRRSSNQDQK